MTHVTDNSPAHTNNSARYITGYIAALVLTGIAFSIVLFGQALPRWSIVLIVVTTAVTQILVHLSFFLHLDFSRAQRWNLLSFLFTIFIIIIFVAGSIWVISDLNYRMM